MNSLFSPTPEPVEAESPAVDLDLSVHLGPDADEPVADDLFASLIELGYWPEDVMQLRQRDACLLLAA